MARFFQQPKFARVGKLFQDLPLEALDKAMTGINDEYKHNLDSFNKTAAALAAMEVSEGDQHIKDKKIKEYKDQMRAFAEKDGFENARAFVGSLTTKAMGDKDLSILSRNYQKMLEDEKVRDALKAQGKSAIDARQLYNRDAYGEDGKFHSITYDEDGNAQRHEYRGGYTAKLDPSQQMDAVWKNLKAESHSWYGKTGADGYRNKYTSTGISEGRVREHLDGAFDTYKTTDEYQNQKLALEVNGITGDEADAMIKDQLLDVGMSRENMSTNHTQEVDRVAMARAKAMKDERNRNNFINNKPRPHQIKDGISNGGSASIPVVRSSSYGVDPRTGDFLIKNKAYKIDKTNADQSFGDRVAADNMVSGVTIKNAKQLEHVQALVSPDGELLLMGDDADTDYGEQFDERSSRNYKHITGNIYEVLDKDGNPHRTNLQSFSVYDDGTDKYYMEMDRDTEQKAFQEYSTSQLIPVGHQLDDAVTDGDGGYVLEDGYNSSAALQNAMNIADPRMTTTNEYSGLLGASTRNLEAFGASSDPSKRKPTNPTAQRVLQDIAIANSNPNNPRGVFMFLQEQLDTEGVGVKTVKHEGRSVQVLTEYGKITANLLNQVYNEWESAGRQIQTAKDEYTANETFSQSGFMGKSEQE